MWQYNILLCAPQQKEKIWHTPQKGKYIDSAAGECADCAKKRLSISNKLVVSQW